MNTRRLLALAAGAACYGLALPPFDLWPLAWGTLLPLILIASKTRPRAALLYGAAAGFITSWAVTWWLTQAISAYFAASIVLGAAATCVAYVVAVSSTFGVFAFGIALLGRMVPRAARPFLIAALWVACEFVRARLFADPWGLLGYTQYRALPLIQIAAATGVYGISYVVALGNAALAELVLGRRSATSALHPSYAALAAIAALLLGGTAVISRDDSAMQSVPVAVVQTNVPPAFRWDRRYAERQLDRALHLTAEAVGSSPSLVVWPENALSLYLDREPLLLESLRNLATERHVDLVVGGPRYADGHTYNSAYAIDARDGRVHVYDKQRLVPAAEAPIVPAAPTDRDESPRSFTPGHRPGLLAMRSPLGMSICHEILYPDAVHPAVAAGATLLVNIANDGWLDGGYGVASRQHFAMAVLRAVEARRYLVRAATTGVSGVVDPWGRIVRSGPPGVATVLEARVEPRHEMTLYVRYGDWFPMACLLGVAATALRRLRAARRQMPVALPAPTLS